MQEYKVSQHAYLKFLEADSYAWANKGESAFLMLKTMCFCEGCQLFSLEW